MRLSPVLVAFLAAATTLGLSNAAKGQTANVSSGSRLASVAVDSPTLGKSADIGIVSAPKAVIAPPVRSQESSTSGVVAQWKQLVSSSQAATIAQAGPEQETPDRIQIGPGTPSIETPTPTPEAPADSTPTAPSTAPTPEAPAGTETTPTPEAPAGTETTPAPETPSSPEATPSPAPSETTTEPEPRVLVGEVVVSGAEGALQEEVYRVIKTQPGRTTTRSQLQEDINAIFATGFFSNVRAVPEDTALGVRVTFEVQPNPVLQSVQIEGNVIQSLRVKREDGTEVTLPYNEVINETFSSQYGKTLNLRDLQESIKKLNTIYQDNGYVLAQVTDAPKVSPEGVVTLQVAEGIVENIQVRFVNKEGEDKDDKGNPIRGRTREFIITREFETKPGDVFNRNKVQQDLQRVFGLGIFEDVKLSLSPGQDPRKVTVVANVTEKNTGSIAAGAGISSASGLFGTVSYQQQNVGGNNQKLSAEAQVGQRELLFDLSFTDPWIAGDPFRTSYTFNIFRRRTISLIFDGGEDEVRLRNGDRPRVNRTGGGLSFSRPLSRDVYRRSEWAASLGFQYQRVVITDSDGRLARRDELGNDLSFSGSGKDDLFTIQFGAVRDRRNDPLRPTSGSLLRFGTEQSVPIGEGSIFFNRLRAGYSFYIPTRLVRFTPGCRVPNPKPADCPQTFAFNIQGGTVIGDLPPYEAFSLGGANSVRGFDEGDLGSGRSFIQATAEFRFPLFSIISGALFLDAATDLGTGSDVPGDPAGVRGKPGSGIGYGLGVRVQSPLGPIRIDYGLNDQGDSRLHFGIGERF